MFDKFINFTQRYAKFLMALVTAVGVSSILTVINGPTPETLVAIAFSLVTALSVAVIPNLPAGNAFQRSLKFVAAVAGAIGQGTIITLVSGEVTTEAIVAAIVAALGAIAVYNTGNTTYEDKLHLVDPESLNPEAFGDHTVDAAG